MLFCFAGGSAFSHDDSASTKETVMPAVGIVVEVEEAVEMKVNIEGQENQVMSEKLSTCVANVRASIAIKMCVGM